MTEKNAFSHFELKQCSSPSTLVELASCKEERDAEEKYSEMLIKLVLDNVFFRQWVCIFQGVIFLSLPVYIIWNLFSLL